LEAGIIEVSTVQVLRLRTNLQQVHEAKYLPPTNGTCVTQGFTNYGQASYLNMKVVVEPSCLTWAVQLCGNGQWTRKKHKIRRKRKPWTQA